MSIKIMADKTLTGIAGFTAEKDIVHYFMVTDRVIDLTDKLIRNLKKYSEFNQKDLVDDFMDFDSHSIVVLDEILDEGIDLTEIKELESSIKTGSKIVSVYTMIVALKGLTDIIQGIEKIEAAVENFMYLDDKEVEEVRDKLREGIGRLVYSSKQLLNVNEYIFLRDLKGQEVIFGLEKSYITYLTVEGKDINSSLQRLYDLGKDYRVMIGVSEQFPSEWFEIEDNLSSYEVDRLESSMDKLTRNDLRRILDNKEDLTEEFFREIESRKSIFDTSEDEGRL